MLYWAFLLYEKATIRKKMVYPEKKTAGFWRNVFEVAGLLLLVFVIRTIGFGLYQVPTGSMETTMLVGERFFADKLTYLFRNPRRGEVIAFNEPPAYYEYSKNRLRNLFQHYVWGPSNWTKRVIGGPGDEVKGVIEDGKPVIYVNGKKIDEPYLNKYPLIDVWKDDQTVINLEMQKLAQSFFLMGETREEIDSRIQQQLQCYISRKSYDPQFPFEKQPFYLIDPKRIDRDREGQYSLLYPGTPIPARQYGLKRTENYWDGSDEFRVTLGPDEYWLMGDNRLGSKDSRVFGPVKRHFIHGRIIFLIWSHDSEESWWIVDLIKHPINFWKRMRWGRFFKWIY